MKINYHFHSGVSVESGNNLYIFDYYKKGMDTGIFESFENIYVFVSHNHGDHYDKSILNWMTHRRNIKYIFSNDVPEIMSDSSITYIGPGETKYLDDIEILALDSTDEGVAFFIKTPEGNIFHSGDLNWWHWEGEPAEYNLGMERKFKDEINKLTYEKTDVAFIPVDRRLEGAMYFSIDYLMKALEVKCVCPIHFWDDWTFIEKVKHDLSDREYYNKIYFYGE